MIRLGEDTLRHHAPSMLVQEANTTPWYLHQKLPLNWATARDCWRAGDADVRKRVCTLDAYVGTATREEQAVEGHWTLQPRHESGLDPAEKFEVED